MISNDAEPAETSTPTPPPVISSPVPSTPSTFATYGHVIPLLILATTILAAIVTLSLYSKEIDPRLYDSFVGTVGAISGVTWSAHK